MATTYRVQTQLVTIYRQDGTTRVREARKGRWRNWRYFPERVKNIEAAISYIMSRMLKDHVGGIIVMRQVIDGVTTPITTKIFQAKFGTDGHPFWRFEGPYGNYWRMKINPELMQRLRQIG